MRGPGSDLTLVQTRASRWFLHTFSRVFGSGSIGADNGSEERPADGS